MLRAHKGVGGGADEDGESPAKKPGNIPFFPPTPWLVILISLLPTSSLPPPDLAPRSRLPDPPLRHFCRIDNSDPRNPTFVRLYGDLDVFPGIWDVFPGIWAGSGVRRARFRGVTDGNRCQKRCQNRAKTLGKTPGIFKTFLRALRAGQCRRASPPWSQKGTELHWRGAAAAAPSQKEQHSSWRK